jgi:hypothetical protein
VVIIPVVLFVSPAAVIPAKAGIQILNGIARLARDTIYLRDARLRGHDDKGSFRGNGGNVEKYSHDNISSIARLAS